MYILNTIHVCLDKNQQYVYNLKKWLKCNNIYNFLVKMNLKINGYNVYSMLLSKFNIKLFVLFIKLIFS